MSGKRERIPIPLEIYYNARYMDFAFIKKVIPMYAEAALLTFQLAVAGILLSFLLGLVCALIKYFKIPVLQHLLAVISRLQV